MWRPLFGVLIVWSQVCLHGVLTSTLYQWIVDSQTRFNYDPDPNNMLGVYNWPRTYSSDCSGPHQSPIDIQLNQVRYGVACQCPQLIYSNSYITGTFKNNGHSAEFEPENEMMLQITNVPHREGVYKLHDFHLHYGGVAGRDFELQGRRFRGSGIMSAGSEHTIDGLRFEGELHFVFSNNRYRDLEEADNKTDGIVVIVMLIQKLPVTMSGTQETSRFSEFLERNIPQIFPYQSNYTTEVDLSVFFNRSCEFYTYPGSTTTPTCHESVRWIIMKDPLTVTERAWFQLTGLQSRGDFNSLFGNYRTTQPLNDRVVEANFDRPSESVLPSPTGESALMMMMMSVMMDMMNVTSQDLVNIMGANRMDLARFPNIVENIRNMPMRGMNRNALVPEMNINFLDMPMMTMDTVQNLAASMRSPQMMSASRDALVPNLDGNTPTMPMRMMPMETFQSLASNIRNSPVRPMPRDALVPNLDGNTGTMPMTPLTRDAIIPNLGGNTRPIRGRPITMDVLNRNLVGNTRDMPMGMRPRPMAMESGVPNFDGQNMPNVDFLGMHSGTQMDIPNDRIPMQPQNMLISPRNNLQAGTVVGNSRILPMSRSMQGGGQRPMPSVSAQRNNMITMETRPSPSNNILAGTQVERQSAGNMLHHTKPWVWR